METQKMPASVRSLVEAQQRHDSETYAKSFAPNARVFDEGKTHEGYDQIKNWINKANAAYKTVMKPIDYRETVSGGLLRAKISGSFEGSPVVLTYHLEFEDNLISSLKITA